MKDLRSFIPDLAAIRNHRGLSLREIADSTKIRVFYLESIENGEFKKLPGGVYTKSYIRQYAKAIDFDESVILRDLPPDQDQEQEQTGQAQRGWIGRLFHILWPPFAGGRPHSGRAGCQAGDSRR